MEALPFQQPSKGAIILILEVGQQESLLKIYRIEKYFRRQKFRDLG